MTIVLVIVAIACVLYGFAILAVQSGTPFFAVWFVLGAIAAVGAIVCATGVWSTWPVAVRATIGALCCLALATVAVTWGLALSCFNGTDGTEEGDLDCIIVLGAQVRPDGPSVVLRNRLDTALDYLEKHPTTHCIVSGGQGPNEPEPEAHGMARYLEERGIPANRITIENESLNTIATIENSKELLDASAARVGIVTNNFHLYRALGIAKKQGIPGAVGIAAPSMPAYLLNNLLRETFGICKDTLLGNM